MQQIIKETLSYLRTNVIKQKIIKPSDREESVKVFNYPYQALEEAVVNALYHRDYMEREPVEITVEPTHIDILSYAGPDRSISAEAIKEARKLKARRYRNRRLGDFLKELGLTEGRATGIPTIQKHLNLNGNSPAHIDTDDDRTYFLMTIPCREDMIIQRGNIPSGTMENSLQEGKRIYQLINDNLQVDIADTEDVEVVRTELVNLVLQVYLQVWNKSKTDRSLLIKDVIKFFTTLLRGEAASGELLDVLYVESLYKLKKYILEPAVTAGYVEMSNPDKPTSSKQTYRLTMLAKDLFKINKQ